MTRPYNYQQKRENFLIVNCAVQADQRVKLKESEKRDTYLDLVENWKKLWNMKVTIIPIVIGGLGTITKWFAQGLEDLKITERTEVVQTKALLRPAQILRRVLETWGDLLSLILFGKLSAKADVKNDKLYVLRKEGRRGLASIEDSVDASIQWLEDYTGKFERGLITAIRNNNENTIDDRMTVTRKQKSEEKQLSGRFKQLIYNISHDKTWTWLSKGNCKREIESLLIAAQNNAIRTKHIKTRIDKMQQNSKCRLYGDRDETINHIICECSKLAQKEYEARHDWVGKVIHWKMCKKFKFDHTNNGICSTKHLS